MTEYSTIKVRYESIDGYRKTANFKTLKGASAFAAKRVGKCPELGSGYAVSGDGVGKVTATGCSLDALFPALSAERAERERVAARVDGDDRDDLGLSPDY